MIHIEHKFETSAEALWAMVGTPDRTDWVPGVASCEWDGEVRRLSMPGAGDIAERILNIDDAGMSISYSCIESAAPLEHHLASIVVEQKGDDCLMTWRTEVRPEAFEPFIEESMKGCLTQLEQILLAS